MKEYTRFTAATSRRIEMIQSLIEQLRRVDTIHRDDIAPFLSLSPSGGRTYIQLLIADKILIIDHFEEASPRHAHGAPIYRLNLAPIVDAFMERLVSMPRNSTEKKARVIHSGTGPRMQKVQIEEGRSIHMLIDDVEHKPRTSRFKIPAPDPVLAAFFGFAGAAA